MDIEQVRAAGDAAGPREPGRRFSPELRHQLIAATPYGVWCQNSNSRRHPGGRCCWARKGGGS